MKKLTDAIRQMWSLCSENGDDVIDFSTFHCMFVAPYFGGSRDNEVNRLLEEIHIKKGILNNREIRK